MESPVCRADTRLIETFRWDGASFHRLEAHLARARASAAALGFAWDRAAIEAALATVTGSTPLRTRLTLGRAGDAKVTTGPIAPNPPEWRVMIAPERLDPDAPLLRHKTTERALYDRTRAALPAGIDEALFLNTSGAAAEGTITNLFADLGQGLVTPPLACGCLPGMLRAELLASGQAREQVISEADLSRARLFMGNALRGLIPARLVPAP
ncbi:aminotransferase class IV [Defluviimonas salinarum]|uniref:Probable branched-chain-amino-acid aminotransferase n=1 Tax=Defluviimonas salinarum TaxID=2992147 RepID=A0ABT3IZ84_9RHOB|nr:aminotransferase class IV [Defluviimonas salinarum]